MRPMSSTSTSPVPHTTAALDPQTRDTYRQELHQFLTELAVRHGSFTLSSGAVSDFYVDCRVVSMLPRAMQLIGRLMLDAIADLPDVQAVGGLTLGADPIGAAVALASADTDRPIPMFIVRKEPKGHGTQQLIEGPFPKQPGSPVVIVEDVITTGASVLKAARAAEGEGAKVARVVLIVDREEGGAESLRQQGYDVRALFTRADFRPK